MVAFFYCTWSLFLVLIVDGREIYFMGSCVDYDFNCRFLDICKCCDGWVRDNNGICIRKLPEGYQPPKFNYCPKDRITVSVSKYRNVAYLRNPGITAEDWGGDKLWVNLSKDVFHHCECPYPHPTEIVTASAKDKYGTVSTCNFSVTVTDGYNPKFENCPSNKAYYSTEKVTWLAPKVTDNIGIQKLEKPEHSNNTRYQPGRYYMDYRATDWDNNRAACSFIITVTYGEGNLNQQSSSITDQSIAISATIIGALIIILTVTGIALIRFCRKRQQLEETSRQIRFCRPPLQEQLNENSNNPIFPLSSIRQGIGSENPVFAIYSQDPPPYEIATTDKLPDYSPRIAPPPYTESAEQIECADYNLGNHGQQTQENIETDDSSEINVSSCNVNGQNPESTSQ